MNEYVRHLIVSSCSSQPSTNGSNGRAAVTQLPKPVQPPAGPAYSVAAGGHHNNNSNSTQLPTSLSPQQTMHNSSNSLVNHTGALLSPSESMLASSNQVIPPGSPLQNGPINLMSPLSKQQQQQMSGLLSMTSSLSIQKPPVNVYPNTEQTQHLPNTTSSLSQSSNNSSFLDEAIFSGIVFCLQFIF